MRKYCSQIISISFLFYRGTDTLLNCHYFSVLTIIKLDQLRSITGEKQAKDELGQDHQLGESLALIFVTDSTREKDFASQSTSPSHPLKLYVSNVLAVCQT